MSTSLQRIQHVPLSSFPRFPLVHDIVVFPDEGSCAPPLELAVLCSAVGIGFCDSHRSDRGCAKRNKG